MICDFKARKSNFAGDDNGDNFKIFTIANKAEEVSLGKNLK